MTDWNPAALPDSTGRVFVVTGGNAGLGYFTVEQLARAGARVLLASRSEHRAAAAMESVRRFVPGADLGFVPLDLSSLASVREASARLESLDRLDGLVLNAGMTTGSRRREVTIDGNERTLQTNYLGHFALTAGALPALQRTPGSRVVGLGSLSTVIVPLNADDLQSIRRFGFFRAYAFSKHAIHGFMLELDRRLRAAGSSTRAMIAHPGFALDALSAPRPGVIESAHPIAERALAFGAQGKNRGATPTVRALLDPALDGGAFVGPRALVLGRPVPARPVRSSASPEFGSRLWSLSERWTDTDFPVR
ncbi:SDR family NAD(P)-dependent oxidoreductase [Planctomonas deserti]|uniref:SDR family NAD(P)-dependent oxidoreductase n=1 Tax=Planctomonas deserti TaxID=2144185 RepID=UPI000D34A5B9|nr:SDR family NAD(P)-dependent oxidoreductase [Planctomonas deserti]